MCQGCVSPVVAFSWLGGILINGSFIWLISLGTATHWPLGLVLAILYTCILFGVASRLMRREEPAFIVDIFLLLGVIGVASSGGILASNIFTSGCGPHDGPPRPIATWSSPTTNLSRDVMIWAQRTSWDAGSTFVYEPVGAALFFRGQRASGRGEALWRSTAGSASPVQLDGSFVRPHGLVAVGQHVCFVAHTNTSYADAVYCYASDGLSYTHVSGRNGDEPRSPRSLLATPDGSLFFKAWAPFGRTPSEGVVYRADPPFTTADLLSRPKGGVFPPPPPPPPAAPGASPPPLPPPGCDSEAGVRTMAVGLLGLATLPALLVSLFIWWRLKAQSMALATFVSVSALAINVYAIIAPGGAASAGDFVQWWFLCAGAAFLLLFISLKLQNRVDNITFRWALDVGCIAYAGAMLAILHVPFTDMAWRWVVYQFTLLLTMLLLSAVAASTTTGLPLVLASAAVFVDAWRLTVELTRLLGSSSLATLATVVMLGLVGLLLVFAGLAYDRHKDNIAAAVDAVAERACGPWRKRPPPPPEPTHASASASRVPKVLV